MAKEEGESPPRRASAWQIGDSGSWTDDRERRGVGGGVVRVLSFAQSQQGILVANCLFDWFFFWFFFWFVLMDRV